MREGSMSEALLETVEEGVEKRGDEEREDGVECSLLLSEHGVETEGAEYGGGSFGGLFLPEGGLPRGAGAAGREGSLDSLIVSSKREEWLGGGEPLRGGERSWLSQSRDGTGSWK
jgi:hypothetical protein